MHTNISPHPDPTRNRHLSPAVFSGAATSFSCADVRQKQGDARSNVMEPLRRFAPRPHAHGRSVGAAGGRRRGRREPRPSPPPVRPSLRVPPPQNFWLYLNTHPSFPFGANMVGLSRLGILLFPLPWWSHVRRGRFHDIVAPAWRSGGEGLSASPRRERDHERHKQELLKSKLQGDFKKRAVLWMSIALI